MENKILQVKLTKKVQFANNSHRSFQDENVANQNEPHPQYETYELGEAKRNSALKQKKVLTRKNVS